jgi:hypothetical protein
MLLVHGSTVAVMPSYDAARVRLHTIYRATKGARDARDNVAPP